MILWLNFIKVTTTPSNTYAVLSFVRDQYSVFNSLGISIHFLTCNIRTDLRNDLPTLVSKNWFLLKIEDGQTGTDPEDNTIYRNLSIFL